MFKKFREYFSKEENKKEEIPSGKAVEIDLDKLIKNTTYFYDIINNSRSWKEIKNIPLDYRLVRGMPVRLEESDNIYNEITAKNWKGLIERIDKITDIDKPDCLHISFGYNFKDGGKYNFDGFPDNLELFSDLCLVGGRIAKILGDKERSAAFCKRGYNAIEDMAYHTSIGYIHAVGSISDDKLQEKFREKVEEQVSKQTEKQKYFQELASSLILGD